MCLRTTYPGRKAQSVPAPTCTELALVAEGTCAPQSPLLGPVGAWGAGISFQSPCPPERYTHAPQTTEGGVMGRGVSSPLPSLCSNTPRDGDIARAPRGTAASSVFGQR